MWIEIEFFVMNNLTIIRQRVFKLQNIYRRWNYLRSYVSMAQSCKFFTSISDLVSETKQSSKRITDRKLVCVILECSDNFLSTDNEMCIVKLIMSFDGSLKPWINLETLLRSIYCVIFQLTVNIGLFEIK